MSITIKEVSSKQELKSFVLLQHKLHESHKQWVPNLIADDLEFFDKDRNSNFKKNDSRLILAYREKELVGRCMAVINHDHNEKYNEKNVRFSFIETEEDIEVFKALINEVEVWGKNNGAKKIIGPLCFSDKEPQGFMIEGFDENQAIATNGNYPFVNDFMNQLQFKKEIDLVVYKIDIPKTDSPLYQKVVERFERNNNGLKVLEFTSRRKVKPFIKPVFDLMNITFKDLYGFSPITEEEMHEFANRHLILVNPRFIKAVVNSENDIVGFVIGMSDIGNGLKKSKGKLFPFGFAHIFTAGKKSNQLNLLLGAVHPDYRGRGIDVIMGSKILASARAENKTIMDSHLELETNTKVRAEMERIGGKVYKRYRIYGKTITND